MACSEATAFVISSLSKSFTFHFSLLSEVHQRVLNLGSQTAAER